MSEFGSIAWTDLTVINTEEVRDFYAQVVGWEAKPESMGDYADYNMIPAGGSSPVAGICHALGSNAELPPQWLIYISVESAESCAKKCAELGGKVLVGPKPMGSGVLCVIQDPAGAVCALFQS